ncbi:MAG: primosomal protein N' [Xanthomonadaceae bacterium]|nr:primosomal protein N' [Xanthomonadaceae bacterium]MDP2185443.1 primosomal protein N' [Xanthomonadales bacterium]MDZ4116209.1 primosomal protein N' [Xanthomonadaceae bacterium]MDZ4377011.1 primosomal protein N' [Xanthomonadaceae bacterium]
MPDHAVLRVALPLPLPRLFDYRAPPGVVVDAGWIGCRVRVPFGKQQRVGVVADLGPAQIDPNNLKSVIERLDDTALLTGELWHSLQWAARYYQAPLGEMLATALPNALANGAEPADTRVLGWQLSEAGHTALAGMRAGAPKRLAGLLQAGPRAQVQLDQDLPGWRSAARALAARGLAAAVVLATEPALASEPGPLLHPEQAQAVSAVIACLGSFQALLLEGVTGSGKTEVYLEAIRACLARGQQALVLVPEIGLTPQTLQRFRRRLGVPVLAFHSGLSDGERAAAWLRMARNQAQVLVGTRSAVFAPLPAAGLIVVDEEHDGSYKQHEGVRYHARDLALVRGKQLGIPVLLGSATPALETLSHARSGRYRYLRLSHRAGNAKPPQVRVIDIRKRPLDAGLSRQMIDAISACLARGEQALVFKNRRGYAPVLICHDCGWRAQCRHCDAMLTVHERGRRLLCHHCGARQSVPPACPDCASLALQAQGAGTERIEDALIAQFPDATVLRVDRQSTRGRDGLERLLNTLGDRPGILVGTQMLAKGHDLPKLTLVAVVGVDEGLFSADFRAPERLAQLLIQVSGRAGRAQRPGEVLLQTHHPDHPLLAALLGGGYRAFADSELGEREAAGFPPFAHLALLRAEAATHEAVNAFFAEAKALALTLRAAVPEAHAGLALHGPIPAPMARRAGQVRAQLLLSAEQRPLRQALLARWVPALYELPSARRVRWSIDVDPIDLY